MYVPYVIAQLEDALLKKSTSLTSIDFGAAIGGFLNVKIIENRRFELELSGNQFLKFQLSNDKIRFLERSMGWKQNKRTGNFNLTLASDSSIDEILGIVLWSLECAFENTVGRVSDPDYWPNFEEAEEMHRRKLGRQYQAEIESQLAK